MKEEILELIRNTPLEELNNLKEKLNDYHPFDIAQAFSELDDEDKNKLYQIYSSEELAEILAYLDTEESSDALEDLNPEKAAEVLKEMELDDASQIIEEMDDKKLDEVSNYLTDEFKDTVEELNSYEEDTAGALMNPHFLKVRSGLSVKAAVKEVTKQAPEAENIDTIFVVGDNDKLLGLFSLRELIVARMPKTVDDIMLSNYAFVNVNDDYDTVVRTVQDYDMPSLPVLENGIIKGIITMDDAFDALKETHEDDYAKFAGLTEVEEKEETIFGSVKKRIPWLLVLLILDLAIALVISRFDEVLEKITVLAFFQAAILGLAGNCGTQTLAVSVRRISSGELDEKAGIRHHLFKEITQGIGIGLILGILSFGFIYLLLIITKMTDLSYLKVSLVVGISVMVSIMLSNFTGALLPVIFYKIKIDPAVASGPFITTLNDIVSVLTYFGIAMLAFSTLLT